MKKNNTGVENRTFQTEIRMETAQEGESRKVVGYAAVYDSMSEEMWGFREQIAPGAFDEALNVSDVRALLNHDPSMLLARTGSGTLSLSVDERGLRYEFEAPDTTAGNDLLVMLKRGDLNQSSFGFTVSDEEWRDIDTDNPVRVIKKVKRLYDVSPVTYPAYPDTTVAMRSLEQMRKEQKKEEPKKVSIRRVYWR